MSPQTCVILLGPPGAGKGTQAELLEKEQDFVHISSGELFRRNLRRESELGKKAASYINEGDLVPDEITIKMLEKRVEKISREDDFILDGFPRTVGQAQALDGILRAYNPEIREIVLYFDISYAEIIERLTGRLTCRAEGHVYHKKHDPPQEEGICDHDGSELYQREDDKLETVKKRVDVYIEETKPLVSYYRDHNVLVQIDAERSVEDVASEIETVLEKA